MRMRLALSVVALPLLVSSCARTQPVAPPAAQAVAPPAAPKLEKVREPLEVLPLELFFSGVRGVTKGTDTVTIRNTGDQPVPITELAVVGSQAGVFKLTGVPPLPTLLRMNRSLSLSVEFVPAADAEPGVHRARLRIGRDNEDDGPPCDFAALVTKGKDLASEPRLEQILDTLGYSADLGRTGDGAANLDRPTGSEVASSLIQRAKPGNVGLYVIARYASDQESSYGAYIVENGKVIERPLGIIGKGHNQTLNPELDGEGQTSFDPGAVPFGIYVKLGKRTLYSENSRNTGKHHVMRVYPPRSRGGAVVPDQLLVAVDQDGDGDFQDYVFMLVNADPLTPQ
jgi:hypothetical protein